MVEGAEECSEDRVSRVGGEIYNIFPKIRAQNFNHRWGGYLPPKFQYTDPLCNSALFGYCVTQSLQMMHMSFLFIGQDLGYTLVSSNINL